MNCEMASFPTGITSAGWSISISLRSQAEQFLISVSDGTRFVRTDNGISLVTQERVDRIAEG